MLPLRFMDLYHTGIAVRDLDAAKAEYTELFGVTWGLQGESEMPVLLESGPRTLTFRFAYTADGPHRVELVEAIDDTMWAVTAPGAFHHHGYWCDDVEVTSRELSARGLPRTALVGSFTEDGPWAFVMHRLASGGFLELVDRQYENQMFGPG